MNTERSPASFRDPSGFVFRRDGILYRQVHASYQQDYELLLSSGLYDELVADDLLVPHDEVSLKLAATQEAVRVLKPTPVEMISFPYEWCFGQLQDAALLTIDLQQRALKRGLTLKDASAYNVQFHRGRPVLIDTLSFEAYQEGAPWVPYRQFCQHFLAPLLLMSRVDVRLGRLLALHLDGIPLDLASRLLPRRTWLRLPSLLHVHLHARSIARYGRRLPGRRERTVTARSFNALLENLRSTVQRLSWRPDGTQWAAYKDQHSYGEDGLQQKQRLVGEYLEAIQPATVWDLGANVGTFSRIARHRGARVVAVDSDPGAVELLYRKVRMDGERHILPLMIDLTNPSPSLGWAHRERTSLTERARPDAVLALALIHHLAISANLPLPLISQWLAALARFLIIEFVPKEDSQTQRLLAGRKDIFMDYSRPRFEDAFALQFRTLQNHNIRGTDRWIYLMEQREDRHALSGDPTTS